MRMPHDLEQRVLSEYLEKNQLKRTRQREVILEAFLEKVQLAHDSAEADSPGTPRDGPPMRPARLHSMTL